MRFSLVALCVICGTLGCSFLTPEGAKVRTLVNDPPPECEELDTIDASAGLGNVDLAKKYLRNDAAALGATHVRLEDTIEDPDGSVTVHGTAFRCPEPASSGQAPSGN